MNYYISDLHFGHANAIKFDARPFADIEEEREPYHEQINALKSHIGGADALVVLLNLKDIINGRMNDSRTLEMQWVTKGIVDYARKRLPLTRIVLVFSQYETFKTAVEATGELRGAYEKYLRLMRGPYPDLPLVAVSAVDRTVRMRGESE